MKCDDLKRFEAFRNVDAVIAPLQFLQYLCISLHILAFCSSQFVVKTEFADYCIFMRLLPTCFLIIPFCWIRGNILWSISLSFFIFTIIILRKLVRKGQTPSRVAERLISFIISSAAAEGKRRHRCPRRCRGRRAGAAFPGRARRPLARSRGASIPEGFLPLWKHRRRG